MNRFLNILFIAALAHASLPAARGDEFGSEANSFARELKGTGVVPLRIDSRRL